ncbi:MAG: hypothetical protein M1819_003318 [Sarea resinae]|nr:MAG: hypothetical protein M1819_003318 [Sarea resinae]
MAIQSTGITPPVSQPSYPTYQSPFGPKIKTQPHFHGFGPTQALRLGITGASFAGVAGIFALYFFSDVPRVRRDIMQKLPLIGEHFIREIPPSDNPF